MTSGRRAPLLLLGLLGYLAGLLLAWAHPGELLRAPDHACGGAPHLAPGPGPLHHHADACPACELLQESALGPELPPPPLAPAGTFVRVTPPATRADPIPVLLDFFSRGPPA